jgi:hypothetical protein
MAGQSDAIQILADLNIEIARREAQTDVAWFGDLLAPAFVMRRANPDRDSVGREAFLEALSHASPKKRETRIESVVFVGEERAIVTCIVTMDGQLYHNLRLFVSNLLDGGEHGPWQLMAWVNEPMAQGAGEAFDPDIDDDR